MKRNKDLLTKKEKQIILDAFALLIENQQDTVYHDPLIKKIMRHNDYVKAYDIYADRWDDLHEEAKNEIHEKLERLNL
jgi:hypothetical protein